MMNGIAAAEECDATKVEKDYNSRHHKNKTFKC